MNDPQIAVIPAAGLGTRLRPLSYFIPKEMLPVADSPMIYYSLMESVGAGCREIAVVLSKDKEIIRRYCEWLNEQEEFAGIKFHYLYQPRPEGIADAILVAEECVGGRPFAVLYPDDIFLPLEGMSPLQQLIPVFRQTHKSVIGMEEMSDPTFILPYGNIRGKWVDKKNSLFEVESIKEKPRLEEITTPFATMGRYVLLPEIFEYFRRLKTIIAGERYATDALNIYAQEKTLLAVPLKEVKRYDAGNIEGYVRTFVATAEASQKYQKNEKSK